MFNWTRENWQNILMMFEWSDQVNKSKEVKMCRVHNILHSSKFWFDHKCCLSSLTSGYRIVFATNAECKPAPQGSLKTWALAAHSPGHNYSTTAQRWKCSLACCLADG
jgi:hypothetical protein